MLRCRLHNRKPIRSTLKHMLISCPRLMEKVFKLPIVSSQKFKKISNALMKLEFGALEGTKSYYMVYNYDKVQATNLFWYPNKVFLLAKTSCTLKEALTPLYTAKHTQSAYGLGLMGF